VFRSWRWSVVSSMVSSSHAKRGKTTQLAKLV
jgi:hypothetical protein